MPKLGDFYVNPSGSRYKVAYLTPSSNAVPSLDSWVFLVLDKRGFLDLNPQRFVTVPAALVDHYFLGSERDPNNRQ